MKIRPMARLATVVAAFSVFAAAQADTYGLLIGINDYPDVLDAAGNIAKDANGNPIDPDLRGCENDVKAMNEVLTSKYGVKPENVKMLLSKQATAPAFIDGLKWLLTTAKAGDQVMFFYSGHGGQIKSTTEADGIDEVIVLADNQLVPDDLFGEVAGMFSQKGVNATFVFDSCYSGGMSRSGQRIKFLNLKDSSNYKLAPAALIESAKVQDKMAPAQNPGVFAFIFAGQEDQPTIDLSGLKDIPDHGLFTLFFTAVLTDNPNTPLKDLMDMIANTITKELEFKQFPRFEASSEERASQPVVIR